MFTGLFIDAFVLSPYIELSKSELVWSIAAGPSAAYTPNILSELTYSELKSEGFGLQFSYLKKLNDNWAFYIEGDYSDSSITSGESQDSDYQSDNRGDEFSRSYAEIKDDLIKKEMFSVGIKTRWFDKQGHYLTFLFGHQQHNVDITVTNGVQAIPVEMNGTPLVGLNSTYDSEFSSWYYGLSTEHVFKWGTIGLRYEIHDIDFIAQADWNLRPDFQHPKSFEHTGKGDGNTLVLGYTYTFNLSWDAYFNVIHREYEINDGYDQTFFSDGGSYITTLNKLEYKIESYQLGFRYIF